MNAVQDWADFAFWHKGSFIDDVDEAYRQVMREVEKEVYREAEQEMDGPVAG